MSLRRRFAPGVVGSALFIVAGLCGAACGEILGLHDLPSLDGGEEASSSDGDAPIDPCTGVLADGTHRCCDELGCVAASPATLCDLEAGVCVCPSPAAGEWHVSPTGADDDTPSRGNGSAACPFKTIAHAIARADGATTPTTIVLHHLAAGVVATYGDACSGGDPCDTMPIHVPPSITGGLTVQGDGAPADVVVTGGSVFVVDGPSVSFGSMTVAPTKIGTGTKPLATDGGVGIDYSPKASKSGRTPVVTNVVVHGILPTAKAQGTSAGISIEGTASPLIGPNVIIDHSYWGLHVTGASRVEIEGQAGGPVTISNTAAACILVTGASTPPPSMGISVEVHVLDCSRAFTSPPHAAIEIDTTSSPSLDDEANRNDFAFLYVDPPTKDPTGGSATYGGVLVTGGATLLLENSTLSPLGGPGLAVTRNGSAYARRNVIANAYDGIYVASLGTGTYAKNALQLEDDTVSNNRGNGLNCAYGKVSVRTSKFLHNLWTGVALQGGCEADLGSSTDPANHGDNTFNLTSQPNGYSGLCAFPGVSVDASNAKFGCGRVSGCGPGTPSTVFAGSGTACAITDVTIGAGASVGLDAAQCCAD